MRAGRIASLAASGALAASFVFAPAAVASTRSPADDAGATAAPESAPSPSRSEFSVSVLVGAGAGGTYRDNSLNRYGFGFGARAGVTLGAPRLHLGASFLSFRGDENSSEERRLSLLDAEVGYDFLFLRDVVIVRPGLAAGVAQIITIQEDNAGYPLGFHVAPGVLVAARLQPMLVSAEVRRDVLVNEAGATTALFGIGVVL
jgi:hypothetical protein